MAPKLCDVCSQVPAWLGSLSWVKPVWSHNDPWGEKYTRNHPDPEITLRSWKDMQSEAKKNGCDLCKMVTSPNPRFTCTSPRDLAQQDPNINLRDAETLPLTFRRGLFYETKHFTFKCINHDGIFSGSVYPAPSSWCPKFLPLAGYKENNAEFNEMLMKDWLDHCQRNHTKCKNKSKDFLPTRLLDVEAFKCSEAPNLGDDVKLVCLDSNEFEELPFYISLSHCWGPPSKRPATTTKANLSKRMSRISFSDLPKTFQDAVDIARKLGQRYLWIDSLCIIQDSEQDWAREASLMAKVYSYAYCTLAALSSKDGSEGLQQFDIQYEYCSFVDVTATTTNGDCDANISSPQSQYRIFLGPPPLEWSRRYSGTAVMADDYDINPLRFRAWALQEQVLSQRTIHFGDAGLLWECGELKATAQLPWQDTEEGPPILTDKDTGRFDEWAQIQDSPKTRDLAAATLEEYRLEGRWWSLVEDYSSRPVTQETDRLIAFSGVAQAYKEEYLPNGGYAAGLWREHLPEGLLWHVEHHSQARQMRGRPATTEYVAPSWSWASVRGQVSYDRGALVHRFKKKMGRQQQQQQPGPLAQGQEQGQKSLPQPLADWIRDVWHDRGTLVDRFKKKMGRQQQQQPGPLVQGQEQGQKSLPQPLADRIRDELKVEEVRVQPKYEDVYGALSDAVLVLSGARVIEVDPYPDPQSPERDYRRNRGWLKKKLKKNGCEVAYFLPDVTTIDILETCGGVLMCLGIRREGYWHTIEGILLKEVVEEDGVVTYRRVGYFEFMDVSLFEGVEPRRIILK
ncbi:HET domain protein pin-c2 [Pseudoneurospora amorphoporcata]|uniref:HET domain protein pin-c2 n=1 Tax=Pseudoneurospora amorphoporcata TaxID=241081 RepID=A0AAN6NNW4_9PEZI|nr:HET domain protein pin-c2 [Pseudoneurospora amorphoporcata]